MRIRNLKKYAEELYFTSLFFLVTYVGGFLVRIVEVDINNYKNCSCKLLMIHLLTIRF